MPEEREDPMQANDSVSAELIQGMRQAMRRLAASVVVVTARDGETRYAMAASAVTSLSMDPPSILVCVNKSTSIYPVLMQGGHFCINILSAAHEELSIAASGAQKGEGRFAIGDWRDDPDTRTPFLGDAQASLICAIDGTHHYGTHGIFIGKVKRVHLHGDVYPLIYVDGRYSSVVEMPRKAAG
jgi:flavin reductase (DIM6/NTAB) family NADH-FMN oxidoreductase RutF